MYFSLYCVLFLAGKDMYTTLHKRCYAARADGFVCLQVFHALNFGHSTMNRQDTLMDSLIQTLVNGASNWQPVNYFASSYKMHLLLKNSKQQTLQNHFNFLFLYIIS